MPEHQTGRWSAGRRQSAISAGVQPPSLYAAMTGADMDHPLVVITVGRCECCAPWFTLWCMYSISASMRWVRSKQHSCMGNSLAKQPRLFWKLPSSAPLHDSTWCLTEGDQMPWYSLPAFSAWISTGL